MSRSEGAKRSWRNPVIRAKRICGMVFAWDDPLRLALARTSDLEAHNAYHREYRKTAKSQAYRKAYEKEHRERYNVLRRIHRARARANDLIVEERTAKEKTDAPYETAP